MKERFWQSKSIRVRALLTQIALILIPLAVCLVLLLQQVSTENLHSTAGITYQYDRYIVDGLDTACRQMESMANTIAGNRFVREYTAMEYSEERNALFDSQIANLLRYSYNRYLPTRNIQVLPATSLSDIPRQPGAVYYYRSEFRLWEFVPGGDLPDCSFYYQYEGNDHVPGVLVFKPSANMLLDTVSSLSSINQQDCALLGTDGIVLYLPESLREDLQALPEITSSQLSEGYQVLNNRQIYYGISCEALPVKFISLQPVPHSLQINPEMLRTLLVCVALIGAAVLLYYRVFYSSITRRIIDLSEACKSLSLDGLEQKKPEAFLPSSGQEEYSDVPAITVRGNDEIGLLAESINDMIRRIAELARLNDQEVRTSQRTAYDMLAAQIHPHFIYNTLENLRMMAEINDDTLVADQLYALGRMLRLSISDASSTGEIRMEIEHAQMYLQLQKLRLNNQLEYEIEPVSEDILHEKCPRFLLQPLVENALKHGFRDKKGPGFIRIRAGRTEKGLWLSVYNDGEGLSPERLQEVREALKHNQPVANTKGGIGLLNIHSRLRMFYGKDAGLTIDSDQEHGTTCTLWLITHE